MVLIDLCCTFLSLWYVLISMVLTDLYGTYWSLWYLLIFMVVTDLYGTYWSLLYFLIFMVLTDLYVTYWSLCYLLIFIVLTDFCGTYWYLWSLLIFMVLIDLYGTYWFLWGSSAPLRNGSHAIWRHAGRPCLTDCRFVLTSEFLALNSAVLPSSTQFRSVPLPNKLTHLYLICCVRGHRVNFV